MDFGFIFSSAAGELFSPTTAAYALATAPSAAAAASDPYTFKNVEIVGGGFVPGII